MRTLCLSLFFGFVFSWNVSAQSLVSGTAMANGKGVSNVTITFRDRGSSRLFAVTSTSGGTFSIGIPGPGVYSIGASVLIGGVAYALPSDQTIRLVPGERVDLQLTLFPLSIIKEQVTVSAGEAETIESTAKSVNSISGQEMRDRADFSMIDTLRTIPGLRVAQSGGFGRVASIKTRGLRNQDTAFLIDGIRMRDAASIVGDATPFLSDITLTSVSRVEVLRGSGSSLYGTNAIGGVIDFQTPIARSGTHGQVSFAAGGLGLKRFRGNLSKRVSERFGIVGALSRTVYSVGIDGDDGAHNTNLQARADGSPTSSLRISGRIFLSEADVKLNLDPDAIGILPASNRSIIDARAGSNFVFDQNDPDHRQGSRAFTGQITADWAMGPRISLRGYFQRLDTARQNLNGPLGPGFQTASTNIFDGSIDTANATLGWSHSTLFAVTAGYEWEKEEFYNEGRTPDGLGNFYTRAGQGSHTGFGQGILSLHDGRLRLAGGMRFQRFGLERPEFSLAGGAYGGLSLANPPLSRTFDGAIAYRLRRSGTKFRAHVGNGYRVPSLYERFGTFFSTLPANSFIALGDPLLKPERSIAADAGVEQAFVGGRALLSATYFYTKLRDVIGYGNVVAPIGPTPRPFGGYVNQIGGISRGVEISARAQTRFGLDLFVSHTLTNSDQSAPQIMGSESIQTLGVPSHQFTTVMTQRIGRFWISFDLLVASSYLAPIFSTSNFTSYVYRFSGNRRADVTAGYTIPLSGPSRDLRLFTTIENLFDHKYYENGFRTPGVNARVAIAFSF